MQVLKDFQSHQLFPLVSCSMPEYREPILFSYNIINVFLYCNYHWWFPITTKISIIGKHCNASVVVKQFGRSCSNIDPLGYVIPGSEVFKFKDISSVEVKNEISKAHSLIHWACDIQMANLEALQFLTGERVCKVWCLIICLKIIMRY